MKNNIREKKKRKEQERIKEREQIFFPKNNVQYKIL